VVARQEKVILRCIDTACMTFTISSETPKGFKNGSNRTRQPVRLVRVLCVAELIKNHLTDTDFDQLLGNFIQAYAKDSKTFALECIQCPCMNGGSDDDWCSAVEILHHYLTDT